MQGTGPEVDPRNDNCSDCDNNEGSERTPAGRLLCTPCADRFWQQREKTMRDYPDSDVPPSWFDPTYAGETW